MCVNVCICICISIYLFNTYNTSILRNLISFLSKQFADIDYITVCFDCLYLLLKDDSSSIFKFDYNAL